MDLPTVKTCRHHVSGCFGHATDALFNTGDALVSDDRARSFPERSLPPVCERRWPSVDEALEDGEMDQQRVCEVCAHPLPSRLLEHILWVGIDVRGIARPRSRTSADRSAQHVQNLPECKNR
jgi:hypothetical protein